VYAELFGKVITIRKVKFKDDLQLGEFVCDRDTILISKDLKPRQAKKVILHELFHAMLFYSGISSMIEHSHEEAVVTALENYARAIVNVKINE